MHEEKHFWLSAWTGFATVIAAALLILLLAFSIMNVVEIMKNGITEWCSWLVWIVAPMFMFCITSIACFTGAQSPSHPKTSP